ncbi:MAG: SCP2 sterol-binding domain-containing protein [Candidatus Lokiarchaeota archaeon]|nr:SCP2 sterol-binding domain-containing protein [Candidatus Lokiarchaeota archaeon]
MVDKALLDEVKAIRENGLKDPSEAIKMFKLAKALATESEDMKDEIEDMKEIKVGFVVSDKDFQFGVTMGDGKIEITEGALSDPSVTLSTSMENWSGMLSGEVDATSLYMGGDLTIEGNLQDAIAFGEVLNIMQEELEDM